MVNEMCRYKDSVEKLIKETRGLVDASSYQDNEVGNRRHYPTLVAMNVNKDVKEVRTDVDVIKGRFKKFWPNTYRTALFIGHSGDGNGIYNISSEDNNDEPVAVEVFQQQQVSPVLTNHSRDFADLSKWCFYNIINTIDMNSFEQFKVQYDFVDKVSNNILPTTQLFSATFIVIDEAFGNNDQLNNEIKEHVRNSQKYNGTFLVSNRSGSGLQFDYKKDILPLISTIIISSDNDAVAGDDDEVFRTVFPRVFNNNSIYYVSHSQITKPNKYIALQMIDELIKGIDKKIATKDENRIDWKEILGIHENTIEYFDKGLENINFSIDFDEASYLPLVKMPAKNIDFNNDTYEECIQYVDEDVFKDYVQSYCEKQRNNQNVINLLKQYESSIYQKVGVSVADSLGQPGEIDMLIGSFEFKAPGKKMVFAKYFSDYVRFFLKENVVRPMIKKMLEGIRDDSEDTRQKFTEFKRDFREKIPVEGFSRLGRIYTDMVNSYIDSDSGSNNISLVLRPRNEAEDFAEGIFECIKEIINIRENKRMFKMSLHDEWRLRLDRVGETVNNEINNAFTADFNQRVFYRNNLAAEPELEIYLLHIHNRENPNETTGLYNYLRAATKDREKDGETVAFINTGYDDMVEAVRFFKIGGIGG